MVKLLCGGASSFWERLQVKDPNSDAGLLVGDIASYSRG